MRPLQRRNNPIFASVQQFIERCYTTSNIRVASVDTILFRRALAFYRERADKVWGLTDCISFLVMQDQGLVAGQSH